MITIYCLVDPQNNRPFYVGATRFDLKKRHAQHMNAGKQLRFQVTNPTALQFLPMHQRANTIEEIRLTGQLPVITPLYHCTKVTANFYEEFFYILLIKQGYYLHQAEKRFYRTKKSKTIRYPHPSIIYKNIPYFYLVINNVIVSLVSESN